MENPNKDFDPPPSRHIDIPKSKEKYMKALKNVILFFLLVVLILGSFWVSFHLGRRILTPIKKAPARIEIPITEPPPSIAGLQSLEDLKLEEKELVVPAEEPEPVRAAPTTGQHHYKVQAGYFHNKDNALSLAAKLEAKGFSTYVPKKGQGWRVQVGAYASESYARIQQKALKNKGFDAIIIYELTQKR
jgi:cell division septation protein DedD